LDFSMGFQNNAAATAERPFLTGKSIFALRQIRQGLFL